jgi:hypothetical protein
MHHVNKSPIRINFDYARARKEPIEDNLNRVVRLILDCIPFSESDATLTIRPHGFVDKYFQFSEKTMDQDPGSVLQDTGQSAVPLICLSIINMGAITENRQMKKTHFYNNRD